MFVTSSHYFSGNLAVDRLSLRTEPKSKSLRDEDTVAKVNLPLKNAQLYLRDLGPQIAWKTVEIFTLNFCYAIF